MTIAVIPNGVDMRGHGIACSQQAPTREMSLYDALPAVCRKALRQCRVDMAAATVWDALHEGIPPSAVAGLIERTDRDNSLVWQVEEFGGIYDPNPAPVPS